MTVYATTIEVTVLSREPIEYVNSLADVARWLDEGSCYGDWNMLVCTRLSEDEATEVLADYGTEPEFWEDD